MPESRLFQPLKLGRCQLQHRVIMAPLTRYRASATGHIPQPIMAEYYAQRASTPGTLLISEATFISPRAGGRTFVPGIWDQEQITGWKVVTDAVHSKGGFIFMQLWFLGRGANPDVLKAESGSDFVSSSATPVSATSRTPRALTIEEIQSIVNDYAEAARNAISAGFDGVEIHGANGYLIDQFTQDTCNKRNDVYGGSIENRARFGLEVATAVVAAVGKDRVGFRISPFSPFLGMKMDDPVPQFECLIDGLQKLELAYLHVVESRIAGNIDVEGQEKIDFAIKAWCGVSPVLIAGGFSPQSAINAVDKEYKDVDVAVVFGRYFISNPDLPFRIKTGVSLSDYNRDKFYLEGSMDGYTNYPFSEEWMNHVRASSSQRDSRI